MADYSSGIIDIHATAAYPTTAQVKIGFRAKWFTATSEGGSATTVAFSLDGVHDHGVLTVGGNYTTGVRPTEVNQVWIRAVTSVGTEKIQVVAWS